MGSSTGARPIEEPWLTLDANTAPHGRRRALRGAAEADWLLQGEKVVTLALEARRAMQAAMLAEGSETLLDRHTETALVQLELGDLALAFARTAAHSRLTPAQRSLRAEVERHCGLLDRTGRVYLGWLERTLRNLSAEDPQRDHPR